MNQANNHALDFGPRAERQTLSALTRAGLLYTGLPGQITVTTIRTIHIAIVGFAPYSWASSLLDISAAQRLIRRARRMAKLVIVIIHAGAEGANRLHTPSGSEYYLGENRGNPRRFAHAVIDAGASLVLGSGPHVIRGIERYRHRMIAYSLGNFAGPNTLSRAGLLAESAILHLRLSPAGDVLGGRWISLRLVPPGLPRYDPSNTSAKLAARLSREDFGRHLYRILGNGQIEPQAVRGVSP